MFYRTLRLASAVGVLALVSAAGFSAGAAPAGKIRLLLVANGGHDFQVFQSVISPVLDKTGDFELTVADGPDALKAENLKKFDEVLFFGSGGKINDPAQEKGLEEFVQNGGAMAGVHATDANKKSDIYWRLIGGRFIGHGGGKFMIRIEDKQHPVTAGMEDFEISDETYRDQYHPQAKLHNLVRMDRGKEQQAMAWVQEIGKGRVFNTTLGHGKEAWVNPAFQRLVVRGLYWAAGRQPKNP